MTLRRTADDATVVVIGGGTMGAGIAQTMVANLPAGNVYIVETDAARAEAASNRVRAGLERSFGTDSDAATRPQARLQSSVGMPDIDGVSFVVEAVHEDYELKCQILAEASKMYPEALIATNTSSLPVTALAEASNEPAHTIGMHFFNPVPRSQLVEIVRPDSGNPEAVDAAQEWVDRIGKQSIVVRDGPGFATTRLGVALGLEAIRMLELGVASASDIDRGMTLGYKHPMGPLELTDLIGLDVRLAIADNLARTLGPRFSAPELLRSKVANGELGKKSGRGFYDWSSGRARD